MTSETIWAPATLEERMDRMESLEEIRQLAARYGHYVDTRNMQELANLFLEDVQVGKDKFGRDLMQQWYSGSLERFGTSIHFIGNHIIDMQSADEATGVVYCRDELEIGETWQVGYIQYWDNYQRCDGKWYFKRRRLNRWFMVDALERPSHDGGMQSGRESVKLGHLPSAWPSWDAFWAERGKSPR